jgi:hypothetical protein
MRILILILFCVLFCFAQETQKIVNFDTGISVTRLDYNGHVYLIAYSEQGVAIIHEAECEKRDKAKITADSVKTTTKSSIWDKYK